MMFKLGQYAEKKWRKQRGSLALVKIVRDAFSKDNTDQNEVDQKAA